MRVLLTEGSGLTSRQVATRLGEAGHHVELLSSTPICLARFTRHVRKVHAVPRFGHAPMAWLAAANRIARARAIDLLFPTHEQVALLSALPARLDVATVAPPFAALRRMQDKISAYRVLAETGLPQPPSVVVTRASELADITGFPVYVKRPISTASSGVRRATTPAELAAAATELGLGGAEVLVQAEVAGPLAMVQLVADRGRLVAHHANLRMREGIGGGASLKRSVALPGLVDHLRRLTQALDWHGALSMDVIVTAQRALVIDVNPRIVEPVNAYLSGVDLVGAMLDLGRGGAPPQQGAGAEGVMTCQLLLAILGAARQHGTRRAVLRELVAALRRRGVYANATEELTPLAGDPIAALPVVVAALATLARPLAWRYLYAGATDPYALTPAAWDEILAAVGAR